MKKTDELAGWVQKYGLTRGQVEKLGKLLVAGKRDWVALRNAVARCISLGGVLVGIKAVTDKPAVYAECLRILDIPEPTAYRAVQYHENREKLLPALEKNPLLGFKESRELIPAAKKRGEQRKSRKAPAPPLSDPDWTVICPKCAKVLRPVVVGGENQLPEHRELVAAHRCSLSGFAAGKIGTVFCPSCGKRLIPAGGKYPSHLDDGVNCSVSGMVIAAAPTEPAKPMVIASLTLHNPNAPDATITTDPEPPKPNEDEETNEEFLAQEKKRWEAFAKKSDADFMVRKTTLEDCRLYAKLLASGVNAADIATQHCGDRHQAQHVRNCWQLLRCPPEEQTAVFAGTKGLTEVLMAQRARDEAGPTGMDLITHLVGIKRDIEKIKPEAVTAPAIVHLKELRAMIHNLMPKK